MVMRNCPIPLKTKNKAIKKPHCTPNIHNALTSLAELFRLRLHFLSINELHEYFCSVKRHVNAEVTQ